MGGMKSVMTMPYANQTMTPSSPIREPKISHATCLNHINRPDKKIITVEDPVEYELSGINQVMVKADIGKEG